MQTDGGGPRQCECRPSLRRTGALAALGEQVEVTSTVCEVGVVGRGAKKVLRALRLCHWLQRSEHAKACFADHHLGRRLPGSRDRGHSAELVEWADVLGEIDCCSVGDLLLTNVSSPNARVPQAGRLG